MYIGPLLYPLIYIFLSFLLKENLEGIEKIGEKREEERNILGYLVGWINGWKIDKVRCFLFGLTKMFSPQIEEITRGEKINKQKNKKTMILPIYFRFSSLAFLLFFFFLFLFFFLSFFFFLFTCHSCFLFYFFNLDLLACVL